MTNPTHITILGCGSSGGVPRVGGKHGEGDWGVCDPENPKNRRTRSSILISRQGNDGITQILVDTSPDLREQLLATHVTHLDAVLFSHDHADQTHGIDDVRPLVYANKKAIDAYWDAPTQKSLGRRFSYIFEGRGTYPAVMNAHDMPAPGQTLTITGAGGDISTIPILQDHGGGPSLGFRFGNMAYSNDVVNLNDTAFAQLQNLDVWIVDALRYTPHPTHAHLEKTLSWIERLKPKRAILTNLHIDMDYETLRRELPSGVEPAYDGMVITNTQ